MDFCSQANKVCVLVVAKRHKINEASFSSIKTNRQIIKAIILYGSLTQNLII